MEFAYLDESGDLGEKGSKHLVLCLMITRKKQEIIRIIREAKKRLLEKNKTARWLNRHGGEIKFYGFPNKVLLRRVLKNLSELEVHIYYIDIEKHGKIEQRLKQSILNLLFSHVIEVSNKEIPEKIIADLDFFDKSKELFFILQKYSSYPAKVKGENGQEREGVKKEIMFGAITKETYEKLKQDGKEHIAAKVVHQSSKLNEELQALDLICGSIFDLVEHNNDGYYEILRRGKIKLGGGEIRFNKK